MCWKYVFLNSETIFHSCWKFKCLVHKIMQRSCKTILAFKVRVFHRSWKTGFEEKNRELYFSSLAVSLLVWGAFLTLGQFWISDGFHCTFHCSFLEFSRWLFPSLFQFSLSTCSVIFQQVKLFSEISWSGRNFRPTVKSRKKNICVKSKESENNLWHFQKPTVRKPNLASLSPENTKHESMQTLIEKLSCNFLKI